MFIRKPSVSLCKFLSSFDGSLATGWDTCTVSQQDEYGKGIMCVESALFYFDVSWSALRHGVEDQGNL
jgi:hypothetical protein